MVAVLALAGCGNQTGDNGTGRTTTGTTPTSSPVPSSPAPKSPTFAEPAELVGVAEAGVEAGCWLLDGFLLLGGDEELISSGQEIRVTGHIEKGVATTCQQGIPYRVENVVLTEHPG